MGRIVEPIKVVNHTDEILAAQGIIAPEQTRSVETDARIDTGATFLSLRKSVIEKLQLTPIGQKLVKTANGPAMRTFYSDVTVYLRDRYALINVTEIAEDCPNLLGQIPLEIMDWVVDMRNEKLIGNPEHGGQWMWEEY